jgi:hypothetical protein
MVSCFQLYHQTKFQQIFIRRRIVRFSVELRIVCDEFSVEKIFTFERNREFSGEEISKNHLTIYVLSGFHQFIQPSVQPYSSVASDWFIVVNHSTRCSELFPLQLGREMPHKRLSRPNKTKEIVFHNCLPSTNLRNHYHLLSWYVYLTQLVLPDDSSSRVSLAGVRLGCW